MNEEEELKKEIEKWSRGCNVNIDFPKGLKYCDGINLCKVCKTNLDLYEAELKGFQKGKLEQKKEDIKLINNLKNPYPRDVFTEPSKEQWDKLQILFEDNNLTQDRYFGSFGRLVFNNIIKQLQKEIGGMK